MKIGRKEGRKEKGSKGRKDEEGRAFMSCRPPRDRGALMVRERPKLLFPLGRFGLKW